MSPNGRRAWRRAAKKLRRKMGRRWRSPNKWSEKRWSELVPDLEAHRGHVTGAWFRRHGFAELDPRYKIRQYIGLWGTVDGDGVEYAVKPKSFTARSLVGMTMGARKRAAWALAATTHQHRDYSDPDQLFNAEVDAEQARQWAENLKAASTKYRIGERLRPCPGCCACGVSDPGNEYPIPWCDGSGVLPSRKDKT